MIPNPNSRMTCRHMLELVAGGCGCLRAGIPVSPETTPALLVCYILATWATGDVRKSHALNKSGNGSVMSRIPIMRIGIEV